MVFLITSEVIYECGRLLRDAEWTSRKVWMKIIHTVVYGVEVYFLHVCLMWRRMTAESTSVKTQSFSSWLFRRRLIEGNLNWFCRHVKMFHLWAELKKSLGWAVTHLQASTSKSSCAGFNFSWSFTVINNLPWIRRQPQPWFLFNSYVNNCRFRLQSNLEALKSILNMSM